MTDSEIVYENGARVRTGYITNAIKDVRIWLCPELSEAVAEACAEEDKTKQGFIYPDNIVTAATLGKIVKWGVELKIYKETCEAISSCDSADEQGRQLYGGGYILSEGAAAARTAAEKLAAARTAGVAPTRLDLSPREKAIVKRLSLKDKDYYQNAEKVPQN